MNVRNSCSWWSHDPLVDLSSQKQFSANWQSIVYHRGRNRFTTHWITSKQNPKQNQKKKTQRISKDKETRSVHRGSWVVSGRYDQWRPTVGRFRQRASWGKHTTAQTSTIIPTDPVVAQWISTIRVYTSLPAPLRWSLEPVKQCGQLPAPPTHSPPHDFACFWRCPPASYSVYSLLLTRLASAGCDAIRFYDDKIFLIFLILSFKKNHDFLYFMMKMELNETKFIFKSNWIHSKIIFFYFSIFWNKIWIELIWIAVIL